MGTTTKAIEMAQYLVTELHKRTSLDTVLAFDTDGSPLIHVGTGVAGDPSATVKVKPIDWPLAKDVLGLASQVYTPHEILVVFEGVSAGGVEPMEIANKSAILMALALRGCRVVVYETANGDTVGADEFVAANYKATFDPDIKYPMVKSQ